MLFFESDEVCETSYADRGGKYREQTGVTLPKRKWSRFRRPTGYPLQLALDEVCKTCCAGDGDKGQGPAA